MIFVGAILVLIITGLSIENQSTHKKICLILGAISLVFGLLLISVYSDINNKTLSELEALKKNF